MSYIELKIALKKANLEILNKGIIYAECKSTYESLVDFKTTVKNGLFDGKGSAALQDVRATTHETYKVHLQGIGEARKAYEKAKVEFMYAQNEYEILRQEMSFEKELLNKRISLGE